MTSRVRLLDAVRTTEAASGVVEYRVASLSPLPKLYVYDHCPFCIRPRLLLGLKNIRHELVFLANDDFETPMSLIGKKLVPILQYKSPKTEARTAALVAAGQTGELVKDSELGRPGLHEDGTLVMGESLDIIKQIDQDESIGAGPPLLPSYVTGTRRDVAAVAESITPHLRRLTRPRLSIASVLPEFTFRRSREMFVTRHPLENPSDYLANFQMTKSLLPLVERALIKLETLMSSPTSFGHHDQGRDLMDGDPSTIHSNCATTTGPTEHHHTTITPTTVTAPPIQITIDDICLLSQLRVLTIVKDLNWPTQLRAYLDQYMYLSDIPTFDAIGI